MIFLIGTIISTYFYKRHFYSGVAIPRVDYTPDEVATWEAVWRKVFDLLPGRACSIHRRVLDQMIKECGFRPNNIPQMEDVSNYLKSNFFSQYFSLF